MTESNLISLYSDRSFTDLPDIPAMDVLKSQCHWVAWKPVIRGDRVTKPPIDPKTGQLASVSDPSTWGTYEQAAIFASSNGPAGVGIVLTGNEKIIGIDLDDCVDETGAISSWVQEILDLRETYAEYSPSGRGIRMLALGSIDNAITYGPAGIEIYQHSRFLTITGREIQNGR